LGGFWGPESGKVNTMFRRKRKHGDFTAEIEAHIELEIERLKEQGRSEEEARPAARRAFGNVTLAEERFYESHRWLWWDHLMQDIRYGLRMLAKNPGFTGVGVLTLALGIGATAAVFSFVDTLYLRRLPVRDAGRLVDVFQTRNGKGYYELSYPDYVFYRDNNNSFSDLAAQYPASPISLMASNQSESINGSVVTANYFRVLNLRPFWGRFFLPEEDEVPDKNPVAVISYGLWKRRFASGLNVLGRIIQLNGNTFTIVGIAPENFRGAMPGVPETDVWIPAAMFHVGYRYCDAFQRDCTILSLIGRLKPETALRDAQAEMNVLAHRLEGAYPAIDEGLGVIVTPKRGVRLWERSENGLVANLLLAAVGLVLLIACSNLAGLLLVRGMARQREVSIRLALGASRGRLVRQLLTESLILSLVGGALGLVVATWGIDLLAGFYTIGEEGGRIYVSIGLDPVVLAFTMALSVVTAIAFGLVSAPQASRPDLVVSLKGEVSSASPRSSRLRYALVSAQVAMSIVLLIGVGLLVMSVRNIYRGTGFDPTHLVSLRLRPSLVGYDVLKGWDFQQEAIRRLEALPGVVSASPATAPPIPWGGADSVWLPGQEPSGPESAFVVGKNLVGPRYFETLGVAILRGREFNEHDKKGTPNVAIVNETLAEHFWSHGNALGKVLIAGGIPFQVVGVARDAQYHTSVAPPPAFIYLDYWQRDTTNGVSEDSRTLVRVSGSASPMLPVLRKTVAAVDPNVPIQEDRTLTEWLDISFRTVRMTSTFFTCFGALALFLSVVGLYGVLAFTVSQRTREFGIRMALGAEGSDVARMVMHQGIRLAMLGAAIGLVGAFGSARFLASYLYGVRPNNPVAFIAAAGVLMATAIIVSYIPARRATKVDPMVALRYE